MKDPRYLTKGMTLDPKVRDAMMHLPWQEAHPQWNPRITWAIYNCGHEFYNGNKAEVILDVLKGHGKRRFFDYYCPQCFGRWMPLPASFHAPRTVMVRPPSQLERLKAKKFIPRTLI